MDRELLKKGKTLAARGYQVQVQKEEGPNGTAMWVAYVPEMPSCVVQGDSPEHAKDALKTVREDYIYFRLRRGVPVPDPKPMPPDAKISIKGYAGLRTDPSHKQSGASVARNATVDQSVAYTRQPAVASVCESIKQPVR